MAVQEVNSERPREKIMKTDKKNDKKVFLVAQELKLARALAGNNKTSRDRALKSLRKWFSHRSKTLPFTDKDFEIIWKGLFFSMWMADKPLIQEECAENISSLIQFETIDESILFFKAGLTILINEWFGIDQLRLDKFLMLVRRLLRHMLKVLKEYGLSKKNIDKFGEVLSYTVLNHDIHPPIGLFMHFTEIYLEEIAKITKGKMPSERLVDFIQPFIKKLVATSDTREIAHIKKFIFLHLMKQSDLGMEYQAKYEAWKKVGFPGTINSMQKVRLGNGKGISEGENSKTEDGPLDPRAGRVDVELPQIKFKAKHISTALAETKFDKKGNSKSRKTITELIKHFTKMSQGVYPLGTKRVLENEDSYDDNIRKAANRLIKFEKKLMGKEKKKKRKRSKESTEETTEVPQKRKKLKMDENTNGDLTNGEGVTEEELEAFIAQSESGPAKKRKESGKKQPNGSIDAVESSKKRKLNNEPHNEKKEGKKRKRANEEIFDDVEYIIKRNTGFWVVRDVNKSKGKVDVLSKKIKINKKYLTVARMGENERPSNDTPVDEWEVTVFRKDCNTSTDDLTEGSPAENTAASTSSSSCEGVSQKSGSSPVHLFESPQKDKDLFPKSPWDDPLQEGEYEICISSKKHVAKLKKQHNQGVYKMINSSVTQLRGKMRRSLDSTLVRNASSTPRSAKKVKINTKLNRSQEIHEHVQQILRSPGIPYDAMKKPLKPLLKNSPFSTPVNPFYTKHVNCS